jgi:hypothetical protein
MKNVKFEVKGTTLTITVDLAKNCGPSKSGKSTIVASTQGNISLPENPEVKVGLNIYQS